MENGIHYHLPETVSEAVGLLARHGAAARALAGGTDLVPALKLGILGARHLVSLRRVPGLRDIALDGDRDVVIGALATLRAVATSPLVEHACAALAEAAGRTGSPLLRNRGTLGGNVCLDTRCWYFNQSEAWRASRDRCQKAGGARCHVNERENRCVALFSADTPAALMVAGARVELAGPSGMRWIGIEALYSGEGRAPLALAPGEIVTRIRIPKPLAGWRTAYVKHAVRESIDFPILGVAAGVELAPDGTIHAARVAVTGARSAPVRLPEVENAVGGRRLADVGDGDLARIATRALGPLFLSDAVPHKRLLAGLMTVDALARAAGEDSGRRRS
ncbi:MAG: FAD binding domain-containing protein [Candidatus Rokubacteria bacterium]|nr:FAD binding domain-containing protein [Candidatus Rokubacteria bacterium]